MPSFETCVFCGASPTTNEDVIPRWLAKFVKPGPGATKRVYNTFRDRSDLGGARAVGINSIGVGKVKAVCGSTCNNGWMKRLEDRTKPILVDLIPSKARSLTEADQESLATWAVKTSAMVALKFSRAPAPELLQSLFVDQNPWRTAGVWIGHLTTPQVRVVTLPVLSEALPDGRRLQGFFGRLVLGHLAFFVFGNPDPWRRIEYDGGPVESLLYPIWPPLGPHRRWPPPRTVSAPELERLDLMMRAPLRLGPEALPDAPPHHVFPRGQGKRPAKGVTDPPTKSEPD